MGGVNKARPEKRQRSKRPWLSTRGTALQQGSEVASQVGFGGCPASEGAAGPVGAVAKPAEEEVGGRYVLLYLHISLAERMREREREKKEILSGPQAAGFSLHTQRNG